jgi:hypothetical protein
MPTASLIKFMVMLEVYQQALEGKVKFGMIAKEVHDHFAQVGRSSAPVARARSVVSR